ncbi:hypothetical protein ACHAW5_000478 [Stephanodiscus triporus]|uniref:Uncharacterized protein n=1 Tax=Stephanodiscus triporus TaxID=2934178 RepID=A0ABD3NF49_9STRA
MRARGARSVDKGQIWGKFQGNSGIGRNTSPPSTPGALIAPYNGIMESDGDEGVVTQDDNTIDDGNDSLDASYITDPIHRIHCRS